jgi:radical SAM protein with 4Fe4S-binding SPASM domain
MISTGNPKVRPGVIVDRSAQGVILLHPTQPRWVLANDEALAILPSLNGSRSVEELAALEAETYGLELSEVSPALHEFIASMQEADMLESHPAPAAVAEPRQPRKSLTIYLTEQCNLRCKHCGIVEGRMPEDTIQDSDVYAAIDGHVALWGVHGTVSFLGGEPLMHREFLSFLRYACDRAAGVSFSTNGLLVTPELAAAIAATPAQVQVSLDGASAPVHDAIRGKGTFEKAWRAIQLFVDAGAADRLAVACGLSREAIPQVDELIARCDALRISKLRFLQLNRQKAADTNWDRIGPDDEELLAVTRRLLFDIHDRAGAHSRVIASFPGFVPDAKPGEAHWCPLGETAIVGARGDVYTCPSLTTKEVRLGNVHERTLFAMESGEEAKAAREWMLGRAGRNSDCRVCAWRNFCRGGCTAYMAHRSGSLDINDEFCEFRRDLYRESVRRRLILSSEE